MDILSKDEIRLKMDQKDSFILYFFTPMCGTCQVAGQMLEIVEKMISRLSYGKADLNYMPEMAERFKVESVPCLIIIKEGQVQEKIYAFKSVPYLYDRISQYS